MLYLVVTLTPVLCSIVTQSASPGATAGHSRVLIGGLLSRPELNGKQARVIDYDHGRGRYNVAIQDGETVALKAANLSAYDPDAPTWRDKAFDPPTHTTPTPEKETPASQASAAGSQPAQTHAASSSTRMARGSRQEPRPSTTI